MIILHAGYFDDKFLLWGEKTPDDGFVPRKRSSRAKKVKPKEYYYDAGDKILISVLKDLGLKFRFQSISISPRHICLPTVMGIPIASSPLIYEYPNFPDKPENYPWIVTAFELTDEQIVMLLALVQGNEVLKRGVTVGNDLSFWACALRFAGYIVSNQKFMPDILFNKNRSNYRAAWEPVFSDEDNRHLKHLAFSMPHCCRAFKDSKSSVSGNPPVSILKSFVGRIITHLICLGIKPKTARKKKFDSMHQQWLYSLRYPDGGMDGGREELEELYQQVKAWKQSISMSVESPFKLCFRLEEPSEDGCDSESETPDIPWNVRYLLQARDDPSLLIPAENAWNPSKKLIKALTVKNFNFPRYLLHSLGKASGICPRVENSLKASIPGGYVTDIAGAYEFLTEKAELLEHAGFGIFMPSWWSPAGTKKALKARAKVEGPAFKSRGFLSLDTVVEFDWQVALGDQVLSYDDLSSLASLKVPLVKFRGEWVQLNACEIREALAHLKKKKEQFTVKDLVKMNLGLIKGPGHIPIDQLSADGWIGEFLETLNNDRAFETISSPVNFQGTLRPYQERGYSWLSFLKQWGLGACLADDMGLGKTIQVLALIQKDREDGNEKPVLVICPTSVMSNWKKEASRFAGDLPTIIHHGTKRPKGAEFQELAQENSIVISSYSLLHRDFKTLSEVKWRGLILDEAQNIKNPATKQAKSARSLEADYKISLTGTPVENNIGDLWSIMEFLNPGFLGNSTEFKSRFYIPIQLNRSRDSMEELKCITRPFILRRLKSDKTIIADLPDKLEMNVYCNLTREQASLYEAVVQETDKTLDSAEGMERRGLILATISKLKQICNHPVQFLKDNSSVEGRSGKLQRITEMMEEIISLNERALIFTQFAEMGKLLQSHFQDSFGKEVFFLYGGTSKQERDRMVEEFQDNPDGPHIFILSLKAGGTGLNLTRSNHVFHFDRWWNPAVENQATDRAYRIGQTKDVQVHKFICSGTLEEKINDMIESKKEVAAGVVGTGEGWLTELSNNEIRDIFALRNDAIGD